MFAFKVRGLEIFTDQNLKDGFLITRLVCSDCTAFFHTNLQECYLCGEINYYLLECNQCGTKRSITSSSRMCRNCYPDKKKNVTVDLKGKVLAFNYYESLYFIRKRKLDY